MKRIVVFCLIMSVAALMMTGCKKKQEPTGVAEVREKKPAPEITVNSLTNVPLPGGDALHDEAQQCHGRQALPDGGGLHR